MPRVTRGDRRSGVVLLIVLFFALLLTSSIATFTRRATVDAIVARNRDAASRASALARGGIRLASALLVSDRIQKQTQSVNIDTHLDLWYGLDGFVLPLADDATLRLRVEDSGSRFNLNSVFDFSDGGNAFAETLPFLQELFGKVIDEMPLPPGEKELYDVTDLAESLMDWIDADDVRLSGGFEDEFYQRQEPPYRPHNAPLMSVDDLLLIEGFDRPLVDSLRAYVTVHPFVAGGGVNLNTAPSHVLALLYANDGVDDRLADEDEVKRIIEVREAGGVLCDEAMSHELCTPITSILPNQIFPQPTYSSSAFTITAEASVGDIERQVTAVVDREAYPPLLLSWKVR